MPSAITARFSFFLRLMVASFGRAYDTDEVSGDNGLAGPLE
jgi:hypothetical protein